MAAPKIYNWTRLWYPLGAPLPMESGYLTPSLGDLGSKLAALANTPCLVLLGAPGMGKSHEARAEEAALRARGEGVDFIEAQRRHDLGQSLIELLDSEHAKAWRERGETWHLLIDGLDELDGGAGAFSGSLRRFLELLVARGGDLKAFRLRLFCRTVEWAASLDQALATVWTPEETEKRQLAPLREADIAHAADAYLGDSSESQRFVKAVATSHVEAIAARPVSFWMLIKLFHQHKDLPARQADLFRQGLLALLEDKDRPRRAGRPESDPEMLMLLAGRIAVAMALAGAGAVSIGESQGSDVEGGRLYLAMLVGGLEPTPPFSFRVRSIDLLDVVRSPLFAGIGGDTYVWAHQTFMEYLAARYLISHELQADRILEFLSTQDPDGEEGGVIPQLREVASWTAALSPAVFEVLLRREPDVLLQSDVAAVEAPTRARLVDALLARLNAGELADTFGRLRPLLNRLDHPNLTKQLRAAVLDQTFSLAARRGAIDIAEENRVTALVPDLADLARAAATPLALKREAAGAVALLGQPSQKRLLVDLLTGDATAELDDELRGSVLLATWPDLLTLPQLLAVLRPRRDPNLIGTYAMFLYRFEPGVLSPADAVVALEWIEPRLARGEDDEYDLASRRMLGKLFWAAAAQSHDPVVRHALARLINVAFDGLAQSLLEGDEKPAAWPISAQDRVALVLDTLDTAQDPVQTGRYLLHFGTILVDPADLRLYMTAFANVKRQPVRTAVADIIVTLSRSLPLNTLDDVSDLADADPTVGEAWLALYSVALNTPSVEWMREGAKREAAADARRAERALNRERTDSAVRDLLLRVEQGEHEVWWHLNLQLFVSDDGRYQAEFEFHSDLTQTPGWNRLDDDEQRRVVAAAETYLRGYRFETLNWLGSSTHHRPAAAGYRALRLLRDLSPERYAALELSVWRTWAPALVAFFDNDASAASDVQTRIVARAYEMAPEGVIRAIVRLARGVESQGLTTSRTLDLLEQAYDDKLGKVLDRLRGPRLRGNRGDALIMGFLVRRGYEPLVEEVKAELAVQAAGPEATNAPTSGLAVAAAELLADARSEVWALVAGLRARNPSLAREIWERLGSDSFDRATDLGALDEDVLARAYLDLHALFPEGSKETSGGRYLSAVDLVDRLRWALINHLVARGSTGALEALKQIVEAIPDDDRTRGRIPEARRNARAKTAGRDPRETLQRIALLGPNYPQRSEIGAPPVSARPHGVPDPVPTEAVALIVPGTLNSRTLPPQFGKRILRIVAMATEWRSGHGGVSTLNRELCVALAAQGHQVMCAVLDATSEEIEQASLSGVLLVKSPAPIGIAGLQRLLLLTPIHFGGAMPDLVVGHDQVTGPYALRLAALFSCVYVHFLHTVPEDIEPFKGRTETGHRRLYRGNDKRIAQRSLCEEACLVVGIGPRICAAAPHIDDVPIHEMIPGLNVELLNRAVRQPLRGHCLIGGRMEDADLKGLPIAASVILRLNENRPLGDRPRLVVRGLATHGSEAEMAKTNLTSVQWQSHIIPRPYTEATNEIHEDIREASVVLMPSLAEGFGLTGFEAIAAGAPVLITEESGLADWLIHLERHNRIDAGFAEACIARVVIAEGAPIDHWVEKLSALLCDRDRAFARAEKLRAALKAEFTWANAASAFVAAFEAAKR